MQQDSRNDFYCWACHKEGEVLCCELCPRVFHAKCLRMRKEPEGDWFCPECEKITEAECKDTQTKAMAQLSIQQLSIHLRYALQRMKVAGSEPFLEPVDTRKFNDYLDYVFHPMDISTLEKNVRRSQYGCTEAFLADVKWILHNCIIYNGTHTKLTHIAKTMVKIAQHEMTEIEVCPECYLNSCRKRENWFCEPCKDPHVLVWAKLQWVFHTGPAKALRIDKGMVDARFFGQHDRAWIPLSGCYLMSKEMPHPVKNKKKGRGGLDGAMQETQHYIDNVIKKLGTFEYASLRTPLTQMDLCRRQSSTTDRPKGSIFTLDYQKVIFLILASICFDRPSRSGTIENKETTADNKSNENVIVDFLKKNVIKHESLDINKSSLATAVKTALGEKLLNFKLSEEFVKLNKSYSQPPHHHLAEGSNTTDPPKKKSRVVTTSGGHPGGAQKGGQFAPRKRAANASLEKTIESCKASIVDSLQGVKYLYIESDDDFSSEESDSSSEEESTEATSNKSTPTTNKGAFKAVPVHLVNNIKFKFLSCYEISNTQFFPEQVAVKGQESVQSKAKSKTPTNPFISLLSKEYLIVDIATLRCATDDSDSELVMDIQEDDHLSKKKKINKDGGKEAKSSKPKSILLNKDAERRTSDPSTTPLRTSGHTGGNMKRKLAEDSPSSLPNVKVRKLDSGSKVHPAKEKKKIILKSTAKILSQKVMNRKLEPSKKTAVSRSTLVSYTIVSKPSVSMVAPVQSNQRTSYQPTNHSNHISNTGNVPMQKIQKYNDKVMQGVQQVLVEMYEDMMSQPDGTAGQQVAQLRLELERLKWMHQQEIAELQHNHDLTVAEIRQSLENEKRHLLENLKKKHDAEKISAVEETKRKQWCANCGKEAIFYCCWNTSYCDYPCQQRHWPKHMSTCSQASDTAAAAAQAETKTPTSPETKKQTEETKPEPPKE
uniref:Zinc finger protein n=1 Tax=Ciona savignyi TaxID=51511 RepID=H2YZW3_CIOSA